MARIGSIIAAGAKLGLGYAEQLFTGVTQENYARFARPGGVVVQSNHVGFVLGHLSLYPSRVMQGLGLPLGAAAMPAGYEPLFSNGAQCQDDTSGGIYPPLDELKSRFVESYRVAIAAAEAAADEAFDAPNPGEALRKLLPTMGAVINFYLIGHVQVHLGQFSAWRRAAGLPAA